MKELTIEEKAKAYDEAILKLRDMMPNWERLSYNGKTFLQDLIHIFPALKESEDERIRKEIIYHIQNCDDTIDEETEKKMIAWLEKQNEEEYALKSSNNEDVRKFVQYIEKEAKAYDLNLPNRSYDIYAFAKDILAWLEKKENKKEENTNQYKVGDKTIINGLKGYILELDDEGEPTVLCSELLGAMSWYEAMEKANQGQWHLPTDDEFKKHYKIINDIDGAGWHFYWTSTEDDPVYARFISAYDGDVYNNTKTLPNYVRAFVYVGKK